MKIIIIEDEILVAEDLSNSLKKISPDIKIEAVLGSIREAVEYFSVSPMPDLIFSDIQLGDGLSFEIGREIDLRVPIIFLTAYDEYALEAFKVNGIDYILKPFSEESLIQSINKYKNLKTLLLGDIEDQYKIALQQLSNYRLKESGIFMVKFRDRTLPLSYNQIALFYLEEEVNNLYTNAGKVFFVSESLEELEKRLWPTFFRVNRQCLVNRNAVEDASEHPLRRLQLNMKFPFGKEILVSREKKRKVLDWLAVKG